MLTKNGKNAFLVQGTKKTSDYKRTDGVILTGISYTSINTMMTPTKVYTDANTTAGICICILGSGTTKESENDFKLENRVDVLTNESFVLSTNMETNGEIGDEEFRYVATFTNNTANPVTITEIGILHQLAVPEGVLLYRKTFAPVTFGVGETKTFTIVLS